MDSLTISVEAFQRMPYFAAMIALVVITFAIFVACFLRIGPGRRNKWPIFGVFLAITLGLGGVIVASMVWTGDAEAHEEKQRLAVEKKLSDALGTPVLLVGDEAVSFLWYPLDYHEPVSFDPKLKLSYSTEGQDYWLPVSLSFLESKNNVHNFAVYSDGFPTPHGMVIPLTAESLIPLETNR